MRASNVVVASALVAAALAGCEPTAPANPSFQTDVMPILAANCVRCHGVAPIGGAPDAFRLDSFADTPVGFVDKPHLLITRGAAYMAAAGLIAEVLQRDVSPMPPRFPLEPYQLETLLNWSAQEPPGRGQPRPDNRLPLLTVRELSRDATTVWLAYELHDPDGDLVVGQLCDDGGATCRFVAPLQSGSHQLRIDTRRFSLPIVLRAKLDDGAREIEQAALTMGAF